MTESDPHSTPSPARAPNRLIHEKSPYLLQHAHNPVDWFPWGEEAFARARAEGKPILLSIGYSTCHWCHVMERESFEDDSVAELLNRRFVAIKVDREERPDVDRLYMLTAQVMGLGGGWPLNLFLTPGLEPFYAGTYFPPEPRHGRPSFKQVLESVHQAWTGQRDRIEEGGRQVLAALASLDAPEAGPRAGRSHAAATAAVSTTPASVESPGAVTSAEAEREELFEEAFRHLEQAHDAREGGFGSAPKFPSVANLDFLLRYWSRGPRPAPGPASGPAPELRFEPASGAAPGGPGAGTPRGTALDMVLRQLDAMRAGGIHDHLGGGFHRYSTDGRWLVPHFEKMLYDQAQLAWIYLDAFLITQRPEYAETARGILGYVMRDLTTGLPAGRGLEGSGAFCSAEDADSEGEEGTFYVWTPAETAALLDAEDARLFDFVYGVTPGGNFERDASILSLVHTSAEAARRFGLAEAEAQRRLAVACARLLEARGRRVRPQRDDKVITAWNGLMISALARGARVLDQPALAARAVGAAEFIWTELRDGARPAGSPGHGSEATGPVVLARRWRDGEAAGAGQLADYADYALGLVELYQATHDPLWLERALEVTEAMVERFFDAEHGGSYESPAGDSSIKVRMKDGFDGAEIAGNSVAAYVVQLLGALLGRRDWLENAERTFGYYGSRLAGNAVAMPRMLVAMDLAAEPPRHVVVAGKLGAEDTRALVREFDRRFLPRDLLLVVGDGEWSRRLANLVPFAVSLTPVGGRATAYVCVDYACRLPVTEARELAAQLDELEHRQPEER
jgi:uncharacterized protein YyaL (SSP411 family)